MRDRVLIVDENQDYAETLVALLQANGHEVEVAIDATSGLQAARNFQPHVVLLGLKLPECSRPFFIATIRDELRQSVKRILCIAENSVPGGFRTRKAGGRDTCSRPLPPAEIARLVAMRR